MWGIGKALDLIAFFNPKVAGKILMNWFTVPRTSKAFYFPKSFDNEVQRTDIKTSLGSLMATYQWQSMGKVILLLHGWESNSSRWQSLAKVLIDNGFAPVAIDAPAHGRSQEKTFNVLKYSEFLRSAIDYYRPFAIIGHSAGGMATIVSMNYWNKFIHAGIILATPSGLDSLFSYFKKRINLGKLAFDAFEKRFINEFGKMPSEFQIIDYLPVEQPSGLVIHDKNDEVIPLEEAENISNYWKNAKLIVTEGFGHSVKSIEIDQKINNFLKISLTNGK